MKKTLLLFLAAAAIQLLVPGWMIIDREITLREGAVYRFRTAPVDPYDPFRGRYVALNLENSSVPVKPGDAWRQGEKVYAILEEDGEGFARFTAVSRGRPESGDYLRVPILWHSAETVTLNHPFGRYYAEENLAPEIERAYIRNSRREERNAFITVRVREGRGVLEELYVEGVPVREYLARQIGERENVQQGRTGLN